MKRKIVKILLSLSMLSLCLSIVSSPVFASTNEGAQIIYQDNENEYTGLCKELAQIEYRIRMRSFSSLDSDLLTRYNELIALKQEYPNYIWGLQKKSNKVLNDEGWSISQIQAIRDFDGTEDGVARAAATFSAVLKQEYCNYNASTNQTRLKISMDGGWSGVPMIKGQDHVLLAMEGSISKFNRVSSVATVTEANGSKYTLVDSTLTNYMMYGVEYTFGITGVNSPVFKNIKVEYEGAAQGKVNVYSYLGAYTHYTVGTGDEISFDASAPGNIGLGFSVKNTSNLEWRRVVDIN